MVWTCGTGVRGEERKRRHNGNKQREEQGFKNLNV